MDEQSQNPYARFFELYTLEHIRRHASGRTELLKVSVAALRYGAEALHEPGPVEITQPPAEEVRRAVFPRWRALRSEPARLGRVWDEVLPRRERRSAHIEAPPPRPRLAAGGRLDQVRRFLDVADAALRALGTVAALYNEWRAQRIRRELLEAALAQNITAADEALSLADDSDFVAGYLAEHTGIDEDEAPSNDKL
jgi:hypothetical protein